MLNAPSLYPDFNKCTLPRLMCDSLRVSTKKHPRGPYARLCALQLRQMPLIWRPPGLTLTYIPSCAPENMGGPIAAECMRSAPSSIGRWGGPAWGLLPNTSVPFS